MITLTQPITAERPVVQTTTVSETYTGLWVTSLNVNSTPSGITNATVELTPFNPATNTMDVVRNRRLHLNNLFALAAEHPATVGVALQSLLNGIQALAEEHKATAPDSPRVIVINPTPPPTA
jgi:hypothetical protein